MTDKPKRNSVGDYVYKDKYILRDGDARKYLIGHRSPSGHIFYRRFKTLRDACRYIDQNITIKAVI